MCGLCGIALSDLEQSPAREHLEAMARTIAHRGPDDQEVLVRGNMGLAFRRLSIIDVEGGRQPIYNETGDVAVACNGEIYNFRELRRELEAKGHAFRTTSDVETIVHLYEEYGSALVDHLVGMFALCVMDWREVGRPKILLARDRIGIKPLYYSRTPEGLAFASETKALLVRKGAGGIAPELRAPALLDYLIQGYTSGPESAWGGIRRLPPACLLTWTPGREVSIRRYWDLPRDELREPATSEEITEWVDRVVQDRLVADVPLGAFLSGGIDSTSVVTSMARSGSSADPVIACSVGFRERTHDELDRAKATAARLGAVHHTQVLDPDPGLAVEVLPWFFDEPLSDPSTVPTFLVARMAREHVTVALAGDGGDEVFGGYRRYVFDVAENRVRRYLGRGGRKLVGYVGSTYPKLDWAPRFVRAKSVLTNLGTDPARAYWNSLTQLGRDEALALLAPELAGELAGHDPYDAFEEHYRRPAIDDSLYRAQYADFHGFLPDQILTKTDRASMANSLEVRVPLLDHRFVERFCHLPAGEKVRGGRGKHALREALRDRIPAEVLDGPKMGFETPLRSWTRGALAPAIQDALQNLPERWFRRAVLDQRFEEHRAGRRDHSMLLWSLLVLEHWRRRHGVTGLCT